MILSTVLESHSSKSTSESNPTSKPGPPAWKIELAPDALDGLYLNSPGASIPLQLRLWTWLCERVPLLRRYRGWNEAAPGLHVAEERKAELLAMLCDDDVREAVLAILSSGIKTIARQSGDGA